MKTQKTQNLTQRLSSESNSTRILHLQELQPVIGRKGIIGINNQDLFANFLTGEHYIPTEDLPKIAKSRTTKIRVVELPKNSLYYDDSAKYAVITGFADAYHFFCGGANEVPARIVHSESLCEKLHCMPEDVTRAIGKMQNHNPDVRTLYHLFAIEGRDGFRKYRNEARKYGFKLQHLNTDMPVFD